MNRRLSPRNTLAIAICGIAILALFFRDVWPNLAGHGEITSDAAGHVAIATFARDHLLPAMSGWNPQFFCGFPQGELYPPLFHSVVGALGLLTGVPFAYSLIVALSVLLTPVAVWSMARARGWSNWRAAAMMPVVLCILWLRPELGLDDTLPGGTMYGTYGGGLGANAFGQCLFLFFAAALPRALRARRGKFIKISTCSALGAAVILSHFVCGLAAVAIGICEFAGMAWIHRSRGESLRRVFVNSAIVAAVAAGLSAFWWIPLITDYSMQQIECVDRPVPSLAAVVVLAALAAAVTRLRGSVRFAWRAPSLLFVMTVAAGVLVSGWLRAPAHLDRFYILLFLFCGMLVISVIPRGMSLGIAGACAAALAIALGAQPAEKPPAETGRFTAKIVTSDIPGRLLVLARPLHQPSLHYLQNEFARTHGVASLLGLFVESSPLSRGILNLTRELQWDSFIWGQSLDWDEVNKNLLLPDGSCSAETRERLIGQLRLFGVSHILTDRKLPAWLADPNARVVYTYPHGGNPDPFFEADHMNYLYSLHRVNDAAPLAEVARAGFVYKQMDGRDALRGEATKALFYSSGREPVVVAGAGAAVPCSDSAASAVVEIVSVALERGELDIHIRAASRAPVPVVTRVAWHPRWRAFDPEGRELAVLRTAAGFCAFVANGPVHLRYSSRACEWLGGSLTFGTLLLVLAMILVKARKRLPCAGTGQASVLRAECSIGPAY